MMGIHDLRITVYIIIITFKVNLLETHIFVHCAPHGGIHTSMCLIDLHTHIINFRILRACFAVWLWVLFK